MKQEEQESRTDFHVKYRPRSFKDVLGHDKVVTSLKDVLGRDSCHSFIFTGPSGTGKTTLARIVANHVGCEDHNISEIDAATHTGVDAMRDITASLAYCGLGKTMTRMIILDEAHALSKAAWQSLLKSIEEPPKHLYWALCTTEPGKIPETIRTRCSVYDLKPVATDLLFDLIKGVAEAEKLTTPEDVLDLIATKAQGSPRAALTALSKCCSCANRRDAAALLNEVEAEGDVIQICRGLVQRQMNFQQAMECLKKIQESNAESIRLTIVNYFTKVAMGAKGDPSAALAVLQAFDKPCYQGEGLAPIVLALGKLLL